jgi:uncharacterized protein
VTAAAGGAETAQPPVEGSPTALQARDGAPPPQRPRSRRWAIGCLLLLALATADQLRAPERQLAARALLVAIDGYQAALSPRLAKMGTRCRFRPTCSRFAEDAIRKHGALVGSARAGWRLLRCGPWTPAGTVDPA